ncbi:unnamed protein product [Prorocentrum cordatum]|uniref:Ion transport domain-containing protein n=1 Tax=Prorocentrum cordatum TaxID=2364126 RepID=A0ABN9XQH0_9DINO|nr:unnamed protein product [Polarella glacialis]
MAAREAVPYLLHRVRRGAGVAAGLESDQRSPEPLEPATVEAPSRGWEEVTEVTIGVLIVSETLLTLRVVGIRDFFCNCWCVFDLLVAALTVVSVGYALEHVGRHGNIAEANVPLLMLRFVLQPARVFAAVASTWRTRRMQNHVDELRVDFDSLPVDGYTAFQHMQEY